jgi:hypothetical protein
MSTVTANRPTSYKTRTYIQKAAMTNRRLREGDISRIAERTGYSTTHVSDVLSGRRFNNRIMNRAFDMLRGRKENASLIA